MVFGSSLPYLISFFFFFFFFFLLFVFCFYKYSRYFIFLLRLVTLICFSGNVQLSNGSNFNDRDSGSRRKLLNAWYRDALSASPALNLCNNLFSGSHVEFVGLYVRGMCCCCSPRLLPKTNSFPENTFSRFIRNIDFHATNRSVTLDRGQRAWRRTNNRWQWLVRRWRGRRWRRCRGVWLPRK